MQQPEQTNDQANDHTCSLPSPTQAIFETFQEQLPPATLGSVPSATRAPVDAVTPTSVTWSSNVLGALAKKSRLPLVNRTPYASWSSGFSSCAPSSSNRRLAPLLPPK